MIATDFSEYGLIILVLASIILLAWALLRIKHYVEKKKEMLNRRLMIVHVVMLVLITLVDFFVMTFDVIVVSHDKFGWVAVLDLVYFSMNIVI